MPYILGYIVVQFNCIAYYYRNRYRCSASCFNIKMRRCKINIIDLAALTFLIVFILGNPDLPASNLMMIAILGSILPDFLHHFFPIVHERMSWLFVVRWLHALSKPIGLRLMVRGQNWLHELFHHRIIHSDISFQAGLLMQVVIVGGILILLS